MTFFPIMKRKKPLNLTRVCTLNFSQFFPSWSSLEFGQFRSCSTIPEANTTYLSTSNFSSH